MVELLLKRNVRGSSIPLTSTLECSGCSSYSELALVTVVMLRAHGVPWDTKEHRPDKPIMYKCIQWYKPLAIFFKCFAK